MDHKLWWTKTWSRVSSLRVYILEPNAYWEVARQVGYVKFSYLPNVLDSRATKAISLIAMLE